MITDEIVRRNTVIYIFTRIFLNGPYIANNIHMISIIIITSDLTPVYVPHAIRELSTFTLVYC